jgi:hypothetical protein
LATLWEVVGGAIAADAIATDGEAAEATTEALAALEGGAQVAAELIFR